MAQPSDVDGMCNCYVHFIGDQVLYYLFIERLKRIEVQQKRMEVQQTRIEVQQTLILELLGKKTHGMTNSTIGSTSDLIYGLCYTDTLLADMKALWKELETAVVTDDMLVLPKGAMTLLGSKGGREMIMYVRPCYKKIV